MRKTHFFLVLLITVFSNAWVSAGEDHKCNCGSKKGWHSLQQSNQEFIDNPKYIRQRKATAGGQNPHFVILSCADSRTCPEIIFNRLKLGTVFTPRVAGNTAGDQVIDSIAFAVHTWDVHTVVVMGHEECGAVVGALEHLRRNNGIIDPENGIFNAVLIPIEKAIVAAGIDIYGPNALQESIRANVAYAANQLLLKSKIISDAVRKGQIIIVGAEYNLSSGKAKQLFIIDKCSNRNFPFF